MQTKTKYHCLNHQEEVNYNNKEENMTQLLILKGNHNNYKALLKIVKTEQLLNRKLFNQVLKCSEGRRPKGQLWADRPFKLFFFASIYLNFLFYL